MMRELFCWFFSHHWVAIEKWRQISDTEIEFLCRCSCCDKEEWRTREKDVDRIRRMTRKLLSDTALGLVIFVVAVAMLTSPIWLCALNVGCSLAGASHE